MMKNYFFSLCSLFLCLSNTGVSAQGINTGNPQVPFGSNTSYSYGVMPTNLPANGYYGKSTDAANAYLAWKKRYVASCSNNQFRVKFDEPGNTVSEGISYGMLLAAYAGDKGLFDGLWAYYKANSSNSIMNWKISGCGGTIGSGGATDAELDAAAALIVAENQWPLATAPYNYLEEAKPFIQKIYDAEMDKSNGQASNGPSWPGGNCRNPSYQSPAYYKVFGDVNTANESFWKTTAVNGAYNMIKQNDQKHLNNGLLSDWSDSNGSPNNCQSNSFKQYGFEAARNPWRMSTDVLWNNDPTAAAQAKKIADYVKSKGASKIAGPVPVPSNGGYHNATYVPTFAVGIMGAGSSYQNLLNDMYTETVYTEDGGDAYFGNTLRVISMFMLTGNFWKPVVNKSAEINVVSGNVNLPSGNSLNVGNITQGTTKTITFAIQNIGASALTVSGISFTGTDAAKFSVTGTKPASVAANSVSTITVAVSPGTQTGPLTANLVIANSDATEGTYTIKLSSVSTQSETAPEIDVRFKGAAVGAALSLGTATTNALTYFPVTVANTGEAPLLISSVEITGTNFSLYGVVPAVVNAGDSTKIIAGILANSSAGNQTGSLVIKNNDANESTTSINLSLKVEACVNPVTGNKILIDYDGTENVKYEIKSGITSLPKGGWSTYLGNPAPSALNSSPVVAGYVRDSTDGQWDQIRYLPCGATTFDVKTTPGISILVYSPRVGVPVKLSFKDAAGKEINADYSSDITKNTTKINQWEKLYFPFTTLFKNTANPTVAIIDIMIDADLSYMRAEKVAVMALYLDELKFDSPPCPASPIISYTGSLEICPGSQVVLKTTYAGSAATTYKWTKIGSASTAGATSSINVATSGNYTISVVDGACTGTSAAVAVTYKLCTRKIEGPETVISKQTGVIYSVAAAVDGNTYRWKLPAGSVITSATADSSSITVTFGTLSGDVVLTEKNATASMQSKLTVTVGAITGVANAMFSNLAISPNPGTGVFSVNLNSALTGQVKYSVHNALGELVYSAVKNKISAGEEVKLNLENLPNGIYLLVIETAEGSVTERLVKH